jgi:hypothetical protein
MTIGRDEEIPKGYFRGGANVPLEEGLRSVLNELIRRNNLGGAFIGLGTVAQDAPGIGDHVEWDTASIRGSLIVLSEGAGQAKGIVTLTAGYTYKILVGVDLEFDANTAFTELQIFDRTQNALLVPDETSTEPKMHIVGTAAVTNQGGMSTCGFVFTPSVDTDFDVRVASVGGGGSVDVVLESSWMIIDVIG